MGSEKKRENGNDRVWQCVTVSGMPPLLKTEWEKVTVRFPRQWVDRIRELATSAGDSEAHVLRESVQIGLPVLFRQHEDRREWVRRRIAPQGSKAKPAKAGKTAPDEYRTGRKPRESHPGTRSPDGAAAARSTGKPGGSIRPR